MISAADRLRLKPRLPVEQNAQSSAQPACEDAQVPRLVSGMNTVSTALALPTSRQPLARAVGRDRVAHRHRRADHGDVLSLRAGT